MRARRRVAPTCRVTEFQPGTAWSKQRHSGFAMTPASRASLSSDKAKAAVGVFGRLAAVSLFIEPMEASQAGRPEHTAPSTSSSAWSQPLCHGTGKSAGDRAEAQKGGAAPITASRHGARRRRRHGAGGDRERRRLRPLQRAGWLPQRPDCRHVRAGAAHLSDRQHHSRAGRPAGAGVPARRCRTAQRNRRLPGAVWRVLGAVLGMAAPGPIPDGAG